MFAAFFNNRFSPSLVLLLSAVFGSASGCQWLSARSHSAASAISPAGNVPSASIPNGTDSNATIPDRYSAFRPIMGEQFARPALSFVSAPAVLSPAEQKNVPENFVPLKPEAALNSENRLQIDNLHKKIADLENQLAEAKIRQPPKLDFPPQKDVADITPAAASALPIINRRGVTVSSDEERRVRIEVIDKVLFESDAWTLTAEGEETLRSVAAEIRAFDPESGLDIEGHTDNLMGDPKNVMQKHEIAAAKAHSVMLFFVNVLRWDASRIGTSSFGRNRSVADNGTPEGRERNNRIEIVLRKRSKR